MLALLLLFPRPPGKVSAGERMLGTLDPTSLNAVVLLLMPVRIFQIVFYFTPITSFVAFWN